MNSKESFLDMLNTAKVEVQQDFTQRQITRQKEEEQRRQQDHLQKQKYQRQKEVSKMEFSKIGVVNAFETMIATGYFSQEKVEYIFEPVLNWRGKKKDERIRMKKYTVPAYIDYSHNQIYLVAEKLVSDGEPGSFMLDDYKFIGIQKLKTNSYLLGYFRGHSLGVPNNRGEDKQVYKTIEPVEVEEDNLINNLAKLVAVIQELDSLELKGVNCNPALIFTEEVKLLPHFP